MGLLVDGRWLDRWYETKQGRFERESSRFRSHIGDEAFPAKPGRYHLYASLACPWAHRTLIMRRLKGLESIVSLSVVHWHMGEQGWSFEDAPGVIPDPLGAAFLHQVYTRASASYSGRVTVPTLYDLERDTIVNNESAEILRMFGSAFDGLGATSGDYTPSALMDEIDACNARIYDTVNNGVYKAGFATTQSAYESAVRSLFETLEWLERHLSERPYLVGNQMTEADIRLFTTLVRFDSVYYGHFKCNLHRLTELPALWNYTRRLYQHPCIRPTVDFMHIKRHYYQSHPNINPNSIVPLGPVLDWDRPA